MSGSTIPDPGGLEPLTKPSGGLFTFTPGVAQGYVRIRVVPSQPGRPFFAYGIINDGGAPGQGSGDGAYLPGQPE